MKLKTLKDIGYRFRGKEGSNRDFFNIWNFEYELRQSYEIYIKFT